MYTILTNHLSDSETVYSLYHLSMTTDHIFSVITFPWQQTVVSNHLYATTGTDCGKKTSCNFVTLPWHGSQCSTHNYYWNRMDELQTSFTFSTSSRCCNIQLADPNCPRHPCSFCTVPFTSCLVTKVSHTGLGSYKMHHCHSIVSNNLKHAD